MALVTGHNDSCDQEHGVSAGVHSSVEFYKSRVDRFMCHGSSHTTKGFPSTFDLFRGKTQRTEVFGLQNGRGPLSQLFRSIAISIVLKVSRYASGSLLIDRTMMSG